MKLYAKFGQIEIVTTHKALMTVYKKKRMIHMLPKDQIPKFTTKEHMIAYQAFADACRFNEMIDIDYLKIKKLRAFVKGGIWKFQYKIKKGFLRYENCEFVYDEDWELKLKEQDRIEKENNKRIKRIFRGR